MLYRCPNATNQMFNKHVFFIIFTSNQESTWPWLVINIFRFVVVEIFLLPNLLMVFESMVFPRMYCIFSNFKKNYSQLVKL
jgi:hypothetical protein